jgi:LPXTG-site transpeptidase (sortase) family protein
MPVAVFLFAAGLSLAIETIEDGSGSPAPARPEEAAAASSSPTPRPPTPRPPTPVATATATPIPNRNDCAAIQGTTYLSDEEQDWYQENCVPTESAVTAPVITAPRTTVRATAPEPSGDTGYALRGSPDRLVIPRLGINAPVNYRGVGADGLMGDPYGPQDVVWYDFSNYPSLGGYPGAGGNPVIAGHVDYYTYGLAVFAPLRNIAVGDIIEYHRWDGRVVRYSVVWATDVPSEEAFNQYVAAGPEETITLVTCNGTFNQATRNYDHRRIVRGALLPG